MHDVVDHVIKLAAHGLECILNFLLKFLLCLGVRVLQRKLTLCARQKHVECELTATATRHTCKYCTSVSSSSSGIPAGIIWTNRFKNSAPCFRRMLYALQHISSKRAKFELWIWEVQVVKFRQYAHHARVPVSRP